MDNMEQSRALERITEANLLDPKVMLTLSKEIFMNRSAELPSPWLHWSQYVTELASEPSIYRSAFSDFHRLALSVTKRLAQTAIIQATSRLRAQRVRGKKGLLPFVRKRDIHTAIDILGMRRNGKERWQGVARRCGFKVTSSQKTPKGRRTREVPWSEVESIMSSAVPAEEQPTQDAETSTERDKQEFKSRAVRSGTPLPMHNLTLSDAEDDEGIDSGDEDIGSEDEDISSEDEDICSDDERFTDDERQSLAHNSKQHRDVASRYTSVSPTTRADGALHQFDTLEAFDQEARQQEEHALWDMLGLVPINHIHSTKTDDDVVSVESEMDREIPTEPENWRRSLDYKPVWETYDDAIPFVKFFKNQKRPSPMHTTRAAQFHSTTPPSDHIIDDSSTSGPKRPRRRVPGEVELQARGTNAYAALQRDEGSHEYNTGHTSSADNEELEEDFPTQSIEARQNAADFESPGSDMDWL
jgi:RNA polymerase I-specific transcription initiation factor RRN5